MKIEHGLRRPLKTTVVRQDGDTIHRLGISGDDPLGLVRGAGRVPPGQDLDRVLETRAVALDRGRPDGGLGRGQPAQGARPRLRRVAQVLRQVAAQLVELFQATKDRGGLGGDGVERHGEEYRRIYSYSLISVRREGTLATLDARPPLFPEP